MIQDNVKLLRLQHTDAEVYDGELLCSTITADKYYVDTSSTANLIPSSNYQLASKYYVDLFSSSGGGSSGAGYFSRDSLNAIIYPTTPFDSLRVHGLNVLGTVSAYSLFFTTTTAIALSVTSKKLNFYGALSITGDTTPPISNYLFRIAQQDNTSRFLVSTAGKVGIGADVGTIWNPSEYLDIYQGNQLITDGTFKMKQTSDTLLDFDGLTNSYKFFNFSNISVVSITPTLSDKLSVTGNTYIIGDINVDGSKNFKISHPDPKKYNDYYLVHSVLEGPELGVYWRTTVKFKKFKDKIIVEFPDYWPHLVEENSIQIYLSTIGKTSSSYIKKINKNNFVIKRDKNLKKEIVNCLVFGTRKSDKEFEIEIQKGK